MSLIAKIKSALPTRDDLSKLKYEFWKYIFIGLLALGAFFVPAIRDWLWRQTLYGMDVLDSAYTINGWTLALCIVALLWAAYCIGQFLIAHRRPNYTRHFTESTYDGVRWNWRWKGIEVLISSMRGFCVKCGTELDISPVPNQRGTTDTHVYCTYCNKSFGIRNAADFRDHVRRKIESDARSGRWPRMITDEHATTKLPKAETIDWTTADDSTIIRKITAILNESGVRVFKNQTSANSLKVWAIQGTVSSDALKKIGEITEAANFDFTLEEVHRSEKHRHMR